MAIPSFARRARSSLVVLLAGLVCLAAAPPSGAGAGARATQSAGAKPHRFTVFESGQVRPLALSPGGKFLYVANTPDDRLEVFRVQEHGLEHLASIPVGLEPVAVAARSDERDLGRQPPLRQRQRRRARRRAGTRPRRAHAARRRRAARHRLRRAGQRPRLHHHRAPRPERPLRSAAHHARRRPRRRLGLRRRHLGASLAGTPLTIVTLFSDTPRALAVTPDGSRSTRRRSTPATGPPRSPSPWFRTAESPRAACPDPTPMSTAHRAPEVGIIVKFNGTHWVDELNRPWDAKIRFSLPDKDVFVIDANANPPAQLGGTAGFYTGVGTILFNMAVNPVNGKVYVTNTERGTTCASRAPAPSPATAFAATSTRAASPSSARVGASRRGTSTSTSTTPSAAPRSPTPRTTRASRCRSRWRSPPTAARCTSRRSARQRSASSTPTPSRTTPSRRAPPTRSRSPAAAPPAWCSRRTSAGIYMLTRFDNAISVVDTISRRGGRARRHVQPRAAERGRRASRSSTTRVLLEPRRLVLRELPRLRRLRQPGLGPRQPGRRGAARFRDRSRFRPRRSDCWTAITR